MVLVGWSVLESGILLYFTCMLGVFYQDRYRLPLLINDNICAAFFPRIFLDLVHRVNKVQREGLRNQRRSLEGV
jgi:hypothetical protein